MNQQNTSSKSGKAGRVLVMCSMLAIMLFIGYCIGRATGGAEMSLANNAQALASCQKPYQDEQQTARGDLQYETIGENTAPIYQALTDAANGLSACQQKY